MKLIHSLIQAVRRLVTRKPKPQISPTKIQGTKKTGPPVKKQERTAEAKNDQSTFFTDRLDSEGSAAMQRFRIKHQKRLRNQDRQHGHDIDQGMER